MELDKQTIKKIIGLISFAILLSWGLKNTEFIKSHTCPFCTFHIRSSMYTENPFVKPAYKYICIYLYIKIYHMQGIYPG